MQQYERSVIDPDGQEVVHTMCSYISMIVGVSTFNSSMAVDALNIDTFTRKTIAMIRTEFSMTDNKIHGTWLWYPADAVLAAALMLTSSATAQYTCEVIRSKCAEVWAFNDDSYTDMESCIAHQVNIPATDKDNVGLGRSRACHQIHVIFAAENPRHCAHLSTMPMADTNGAFKCQDEEDGGPTYYPPNHYFSDEEIEFAKQFGRQYGLFTGDVGGYMPVDDVSAAFDPITTSTNTDLALPLHISPYIPLAMILLGTI